MGKNRFSILHTDALAAFKTMPDNSYHGCLTDPPYGLSFMGHGWDHGVPSVDVWRELLRVLRPGAHVLAFGGTRTFHRLTCAIEDAGFEIRDCMMWLYGSGFPKSLDVAKAIDKARDDSGEIRRVCRFLREAMGRENVTAKALGLAFGMHPRMVDHWAARDTDSQPTLPTWKQWMRLKELLSLDSSMDGDVWRLNGRKGEPGNAWRDAEITGELPPLMSGLPLASFSSRDNFTRAANSEAARQWSGHGTALKPAWEPIIVARKPLDGTVAQNVQRWGCGALAIDACRIESSGPDVNARKSKGTGLGFGSGADTPRGEWSSALGRWPANVILDEEAGQVLDAQSGNRKSASNTKPSTGGAIMSGLSGEARANGYRAFADGNPYRGEEGGASRFFKSCDFSQDEVVFSRAMAMLNGCNFDHASIANAHSSQSKLRADSALNDAVTLVSQGATRLLGWSGLSTVATPSESKTLSATLIATILSFGEGSSQEPQHERSFPTGSRASVAQHQRQTDTTTITISHWRSDGSAEPVTFSITPLNSVHGEAGSSRFIYQAKASREERDAGLADFEAGKSLYSRGTGLKANGDGSERSERSETRNIHPTVKPLALARYLARLILPPIPDARMVVPFCGSGSEVIGALQAGWSHVDGIDSWDVAVDIARSRVAHWNKPVEQLDLTGEE